MPIKHKTRPRGKRKQGAGAHWLRAAKEAGEAAALAALPILIKSLSEALPKNARQTALQRSGPPARTKSGGKKNKPDTP
jgi:hypothetical protein